MIVFFIFFCSPRLPEHDIYRSKKGKQKRGEGSVFYFEHFLVPGWAWLASYAWNMPARSTPWDNGWFSWNNLPHEQPLPLPLSTRRAISRGEPREMEDDSPATASLTIRSAERRV